MTMTIVVNEGEGNIIIKLIRGISIHTQRVHRIGWAHHYFFFQTTWLIAGLLEWNAECVRVCMHSYYAKHKIATFLSLSTPPPAPSYSPKNRVVVSRCWPGRTYLPSNIHAWHDQTINSRLPAYLPHTNYFTLWFLFLRMLCCCKMPIYALVHYKPRRMDKIKVLYKLYTWIQVFH